MKHALGAKSVKAFPEATNWEGNVASIILKVGTPGTIRHVRRDMCTPAGPFCASWPS